MEAGGTTIITPPTGRWVGSVRELVSWRELLAFLVWRDLKIRYKQTLLGAAWALLQPVLAMIVFGLFFGRIARIGIDGVPYWLFALAGLVPWIYFSNALGQASLSLVDNERVIAKVYFPRLLLPASPVLSGLFDLVVSSAVLLALGFAVLGLPHRQLVLLPLFVMLASMTALGIGLLLSCANVRYRDVRYVVPFLIQLLLFASPVAYASDVVPAPWHPVYATNPMVTAIDGVRWAVLDGPAPAPVSVIVSVTVAIGLVVVGTWAFSRAERSFADVL